MSTPRDFTHVVWRKSSHSGDNGGQCVEIAHIAGWTAIRDSKQSPGPVLLFNSAQVANFLASIKRGELDAS